MSKQTMSNYYLFVINRCNTNNNLNVKFISTKLYISNEILLRKLFFYNYKIYNKMILYNH